MDFYVKGTHQSKWMNPFTSKNHGDDCLILYEKYIRQRKELYDALDELEGKELGCWCKPKQCHGDILIKLLNEKNKK